MGLLGGGQMGSPVQKHEVQVGNDLFWVTGELAALGNPHHYINQDGLDIVQINDAQIVPWSFSGLPASRPPTINMTRERIQYLMFPQEASMADFRPPPNSTVVMIHLPLAIVRGSIPLLSEAQAHNFLDFWKGLFFPVLDAEVYPLANCSVQIPNHSRIVYINRKNLLSYVSV